MPEVSVGPTNRRSRMPVRVRIHSSDVSTKFVNHSLGTTRSGTLDPVPMMAAAIDPFIPNTLGKGRQGGGILGGRTDFASPKTSE